MLQGIPQILSKFTTGQRLAVLTMLLVTILLLTFGGDIIQVGHKTDEVLLDRIQRLEKRNSLIAADNDSLLSMLSDSKVECAVAIVEVKRRLLAELFLLERDMVAPVTKVKQTIQTVDTVEVLGSYPKPVEETEFTPPVKAVQRLQKLKSDLGKDIQ